MHTFFKRSLTLTALTLAVAGSAFASQVAKPAAPQKPAAVTSRPAKTTPKAGATSHSASGTIAKFDSNMLTLKTLLDERMLKTTRSDLLSMPPRIEAPTPRTRAVLGYFAANCGTCHNSSGEIAYAGPSLKHSDVAADGDAVARALLNQATAWQLPGRADGTTRMLDAVAPDASAMLYRMRSRRPTSQMPPLGTVIRDDEAIAFISSWIQKDLRKD